MMPAARAIFSRNWAIFNECSHRRRNAPEDPNIDRAISAVTILRLALSPR